MTKRFHSETLDAVNAMEKLSSNTVDDLVESVGVSIQNTPSWIRIQDSIDSMWSTYTQKEIERRMLFYRFPGGSKKGRKIIMRDFDAAFQTLMRHYFVENSLYPVKLFSRRFRVSKEIFERVYHACLKHPVFRHEKNAAGRRGIHPLVKTTACFRHIAYGTSADQLDECFQISESTFLESRLAFCDVWLFACECLLHLK
jgi:hypothetical protein